ncbi:MAG TPA: Uma2 family endonuclease [Tepidisphaeraceae bacterium]|nr:Uma2 family endonuclease [Tepidisphaeraceae bacterium]
MPVTHERLYTADEYLRLEHGAEEKHEYERGRIVGMAGASVQHVRIATSLLIALGGRLRGSPCAAFGSDLRVRLQDRQRYVYPDVTVICGKVELDPTDKWGQTATNPRLVVEVMSPSTEKKDRGEKFDRYRAVPSLREYVLVDQEQARVDTYHRNEDRTWTFDAAVGVGAVVRLRSLGIDVPLAEVYAGAELAPVIEPQDEVPPGS